MKSGGDDRRGILWAEWLLIEINLLAEGERWKSMLFFYFELDLKLATVGSSGPVEDDYGRWLGCGEATAGPCSVQQRDDAQQ